MKICIFTSSFLPKIGGLEFAVQSIAESYIAEGHEVVVLAKTPRGKWTKPEFTYPVYYYPRTHSQTWLLGNTFKQLENLIKKNDFDAIHTQQIYPTGYIAAKLGKKYGIPVLVTSHNCNEYCTSRFSKKRIPAKRMTWTIKNANWLTSPSLEAIDDIKRLTGIRHCSCLPNGVEPHSNVSSSKIEDKFNLTSSNYMLTLGRLHPYKGLKYLIEALAIMQNAKQAFPDLVIAGFGKLEAELKELAKSLDLSKKIIFPGLVEGNEKYWLLQKCKIFIQPSVVDGLPLTVLEAMSSAKPILTTKVGGLPSLLTDGEDGFLVPKASAEALAEKLFFMLNSCELEQMGEAARRKIAQYSWANIIKQYMERLNFITQM